MGAKNHRGGHSEGARMAFRLKLPGGMLKIKTYRELRERERARRVPVLKLGRIYIIWWPD